MEVLYSKPRNAIMSSLALITLTVMLRPAFFRRVLPRFVWKKINFVRKLLGGTSDIESMIRGQEFEEAFVEIKKSKQLVALKAELAGNPTESSVIPSKLVAQVKKIRNMEQFESNWQRFITIITKMNGYKTKLTQMKKTKYETENEGHEAKLMKLWDLVGYGELDNRYSQMWVKIGFQGENPATDFRGGGLLSLENLLYFGQKHKSTCLKVRDSAQLSEVWYCYAITGINITGWVWDMVNDGIFDRVYIHKLAGNSGWSEEDFMEFFNEVYCLVFVQFDIEWVKSKPASVMEFSIVQNKYLPQARKEFAQLDVGAKSVLMDYLNKKA